jgi:hypothetical protein
MANDPDADNSKTPRSLNVSVSGFSNAHTFHQKRKLVGGAACCFAVSVKITVDANTIFHLQNLSIFNP